MEKLTEEFRQLVRAIVQEELEREKAGPAKDPPLNQISIPGLTQKPLYNMREVRQLFGNVSRTTVYAWAAEGKLKPRKLKGKVYFLWEEIEKMLKEYIPGNRK